jgi:hypothetical protein
MNRRYVIAGVAVVAVAGLWFMYNQSNSGGGSSGAVASSSAGPQISGVSPAGGALPTAQLYGATTATTPTAPTGTLGSLITFGQPRDAFVQVVGGGTASGNSLSFGSTPTTTTSPISLGSGATSAVPSSSGTPTTTPTTPTTPVTGTTPTGQTLAAEFDINGEPVVAYLRDAIPPETQQFIVNSITSTKVVLGLNGALLANGASSVTIKVGQTLTLDNQTANTTTVIHLLSVHSA